MKLSSLKKVLVSSLFMMVAAGAQAEVRYNVGELMFEQMGVKGTSKNVSGLTVGGNYRINEKFLGRASYGTYSVSGVDFTALVFGGSYIHPLDSKTNLLGGLFFSNSKVTGSSSSTDLGIQGRIDHRLKEEIQIDGTLTLLDGNLSLYGGGYYFLDDNKFAVRGQLGFSDGSLGFGIGGAMFF